MTLINQTKYFLNDTGTTQAKLAKEVGISSGALSAYLNESYKGSVEEIEAKLTAYFQRQNIKMREFVEEAPAFIETATAKRIFQNP